MYYFRLVNTDKNTTVTWGVEKQAIEHMNDYIATSLGELPKHKHQCLESLISIFLNEEQIDRMIEFGKEHDQNQAVKTLINIAKFLKEKKANRL